MALIDRERMTCIGRVAQAHGTRGELRVAPLSDTPDHFRNGHEVLLDAGGGLRPSTILTLRTTREHWIVRLEGIDNRNDAEAIVGAELLVDDSHLAPLAPDEYFQHDLIGCNVVTLKGRPLGMVTGIVITGANDVLEVIAPDGNGIMVPMIGSVIRKVDLLLRNIHIDPLPGLLDEEDEA